MLSGGEQAKLRLCKLMNRESNVLFLDEPTNHLDVDAKEELRRALSEYRGSILLICHEPEFYDGLATKVVDCGEWVEKNINQGVTQMEKERNPLPMATPESVRTGL